MRGREIERLYSGNQLPGYYSITWDATNYSTELYFVRMESSEFTQTKIIVLVK